MKRIGYPVSGNAKVAVSSASSHVTYSWPGCLGSTVRPTWNDSSPSSRVGSDSVCPPSSEVDSHTAWGRFPCPRNVTNSTYSRPSGPKPTSGAKHLDSCGSGTGSEVAEKLAAPSVDTCSAQPKSGLSLRLATTTLAASVGLRATTGELWLDRSIGSPAPSLTGALLPTSVASGSAAITSASITAPTPTSTIAASASAIATDPG